MARSTMFYRAFLVLVSIAQSSASVSSSSGVLMISLVPLTLAPLTNAADAAADSPDQECKEPGTRGNENSDADNSNTDATNTESSSVTNGSHGQPLITHDELALRTGKDGSDIWLSILGIVYDVTTGPDFYGADKGSYKFYAGRDASPCFSTGQNNQDGSEEKLEEWEDKKLMSVYEWSEFYADHETYKYLGRLAGSRYFDEGGNETPLRVEILTRASEAKKIADEERARKKKERTEKREAKKREKAEAAKKAQEANKKK